jgi:Bax protein
MTPVGSLRVRTKYALRVGTCAMAVLLCGSSGLAERPNSDFNAGRELAALFSAPLSDMGGSGETQPAREGAGTRDYTLDAVRDDGAAVPRLFLARVPADLRTLESPEVRKERFVKILLPLILAENERVLSVRKHLLHLRDSLKADVPLRAADRMWLEALADRYEVDYDADALADTADLLVQRVDIVPPSLALGQAALETGWGTSAAARGQAMFGQMIFSDDGERAEVRRFERLAHAVQAYELNLNTHRAYTRFRALRATMRTKHRQLNGYELAQTLVKYSERKMDYVKDVRGLIRSNKLQPLDAARLDDSPQLAGR